jgi:hypothetical protein
MPPRFLAVALLGSLASPAGAAGVLKLTNAGPAGREIPLLAGSLVHFDADGSLRMECDPAVAACLGSAAQAPDTLPSASLQRTDGAGALLAGESIRLAWTSTQGDVCKATTGGAATSWSGARGAANAAGESIVLLQAGTYAFGLACYNHNGGIAANPVVVTVAAGNDPPPPPPAGCGIASNDPAFQPPAWKRIDKTWTQTFSPPDGTPPASFPNASSWPVPVGSQRGAYTSVAFVPNPAQSVQLHWDRVQARLGEYDTVRPATAMFIGISPCPGDLRATVDSDVSGWLKEGCRKFASSATLIFSTSASYPDSAPDICKLEAGKTYYLNIAPVDPAGGLAPGEHSCDDIPNAALECHVGVVASTAS